ncbi:germin-like protein 9-1 [Hordeum vulgare subsp. vulgare]|uniref:Germin-like protein n=1 Tax=Hordeum vulgare subsp. vulgare TaxID=112509 RepID=A0A8I6XEV4_HORVV|nr:germin-like protein 9-1 [Hordeum vulgare subsp. vulgare]KAI4998852.1 hypothetical protein ZWY2020_054194 [Hordeum vulgare]
MAPSSLTTLLVLLAVVLVAHGSDPDILTDFVVPPGTNASLLDGTFFTYAGLIAGNSADPAKFTVSKATAAEFPALLGQSVSYAALVFGPGTVNPPHVHPRASELLYVVQGPLMVGLVDEIKRELYAQTLQTGDMFVFPKGMVHFQFNGGADVARAFSAFGSASPGTVSLPVALFESGISDAVLEKSFNVDEATVLALEHDLAPAAPAPAPAPDSPPAPKNGGAAPVPACLALMVGFAATLLLL